MLEDYEHARRRNAPIRAELTGYCSTGSGLHVSQSSGDSIVASMTGALAEAGVSPAEVDYINAHATATIQGDQEEAAAIRELFGDRVPVSSLKGYFGHTLGASGALELALGLVMMETGTIYPTRNLENVARRLRGHPARPRGDRPAGRRAAEELLRLWRHQREPRLSQDVRRPPC